MSSHHVLLGGAWRASSSTACFRAHNPATGQPLPDDYPVSSWEDCDAALDGGRGSGRGAAARRPGPDCRVPESLRGSDRRAQGRDRRAGAPRKRSAGLASPGGCRAAAHDRSAPPGGRGRAGRIVGAADDRYEAQHPLGLRANRPGRRLRAEQLSARLLRRGRRRLRGGDCRGQPGHREGTPDTSGHGPDARGGGVRLGGGNGSAGGDRAIDLPHRSAVGVEARLGSARRRDRFHRKPRGWSEAQGRGGRRWQAHLPGALEHQPRGDPPGRAGGARQQDCRRVRRKLYARRRPVLHESRTGPPVRGRRDRGVHCRREGEVRHHCDSAAAFVAGR